MIFSSGNMIPLLIASALTNLAIGVALLLVWRQDRSQEFTRWLGLSFVTVSVWLPALALFYRGGHPWDWLGAVLWAAESVYSILFVLIGAIVLSGQTRDTTPLLRREGPILVVLYTATLILNPRIVAVVASATYLPIAGWLGFLLWKQGVAERIAAILMVTTGVFSSLTGVLGLDAFGMQVALVGISRLALGLALAYAGLQRIQRTAQRLAFQLSQLTERSLQGVLITGAERILYANEQAKRLLGLDDKRTDARALERLLKSASMASRESGDTPNDAGVPHSWEREWVRGDGHSVYLRMSSWAIEWDDGPAHQVVLTDETDLHLTRKQRVFQEAHDSLTGLVNRQAIKAHFQEQVGRHPGMTARLTLMHINLDHFSSINDSLGLEVGDQLLREVAHRMRGLLEQGDVLARLSGDEFLLCFNTLNFPDREFVPRSLQTAMRTPFDLRGLRVVVSVSIGLAHYPAHGVEFDEVAGHALLAARRAKEAGRSKIVTFESRMKAERVDQVRLAAELRAGLEAQEFELYFQPVFAAAAHALVGAEGLLRWHHPREGLVLPDRFLATAEADGIIVEIGTWVIREAVRTLRRWSAIPALNPLWLAVNVSASQFSRSDLRSVLDTAFADYGSVVGLELEVTESAFIDDPELFIETLARLKGRGLTVAIDDFGTGYSSLSHLQRFKADKLKIDQSFVKRMAQHHPDRAIVQAVIQMAHSLGLVITAEGVEDEETVARLNDLGCDQLQGSYFSPPLPAVAFEAFAQDDSGPLSTASEGD